MSPELLQDGDPDPGIQGDLVLHTDRLQRWRLGNRIDSAEEGRVHIAKALRGLDRIHPDVEHWHALLALQGVDGEQDLVVQVHAVGLQHHAEHLVDLLLDSVLPLTLALNGQTRQAQDGEPILL